MNLLLNAFVLVLWCRIFGMPTCKGDDQPLVYAAQFFKFHEVEHEILSLPTNEAHKDFDLIFRVADALERFGINRCWLLG